MAIDPKRIAPEGMIWVCAACGKTARDQYGIVGEHSYGWDEACVMHSVLCHEKPNEAGQFIPAAPKASDNG